MVHPHSLSAYRAIPNLGSREDRVAEIVTMYPGVSANDIERIMRSKQTKPMSLKNIRSRLSDMLRDGEIVCTGRKKDALTKRTVNQYEVI